MYASKKSVTKAQGLNTTQSKNTKINTLRHRGMQKTHVQVTPDGKVIQHYKVDSRSAQVMKAFKQAQAEANKTEVTEEAPAEATE